MDTVQDVHKQWHSFIHNPADIRRFADIFGMKEKHLALCMFLAARRKYYPSLSRSLIICNRPIIPGGGDYSQRVYQYILRLESPIGSYTDNGNIIPNDAFALYVMLNPKDTIKSLAKTLVRCLDDDNNQNGRSNGFKLYKEEIAKCDAQGTVKYKQIDLDTKDIGKVLSVHDLLTKLSIPIIISIETRGGFHLVYSDNLPKNTSKLLYDFKQTTKFQAPNIDGKMVNDYWFSITNQSSVIMPGTYQGGFPARIITLDDWLKQ